MEREHEPKSAVTGSLHSWTLSSARRLIEQYSQIHSSMAALIESGPNSQGDEVQRMLNFYERTDLSGVSQLVDRSQANDAPQPGLVLQRLAPYFEAGLLVQSKTSGASGFSGANKPPSDAWLLTAFVNRGEVFFLEDSDQINLSQFVPTLSPLEIKKTSGPRLKDLSGLSFLQISRDTDAYIFRPDAGTAFVLFCGVPQLWREDHLQQTLRLINLAFN